MSNVQTLVDVRAMREPGKRMRSRLLDAAVEMGRQIAANTPEMVQGIKRLLLDDIGRDWRRMYDVMRYWDTAHTRVDQPAVEYDFAAVWQAADKIVSSRTLEILTPSSCW